MTDFQFYFELGLWHVLDWKAYDHVLFIVVLCIMYSLSTWKRLLALVTVFTLGHTVSLFLSGQGITLVEAKWIEFLVPLTIMATALANMLWVWRSSRPDNTVWLYIITLFFGVIHGFGFGRYFNQINDEQAIIPLLEFALGIETAQLVVVLVMLLIGYLFYKIMPIKKQFSVLMVSAIAILASLVMLIENWPFRE